MQQALGKINLSSSSSSFFVLCNILKGWMSCESIFWVASSR
jgi:hypothetical protein